MWLTTLVIGFNAVLWGGFFAWLLIRQHVQRMDEMRVQTELLRRIDENLILQNHNICQIELQRKERGL